MLWLTAVFLVFYIHRTSAVSIGRFDCDISKIRCKYIPDHTITAVLSERDVSYNVSVEQLPLIGLNVSSTIFKTGYTTANLHWLSSALDFGYQAIDLDVYYYKGNWQVCPGILPQNQALNDSSNSLIYANLTGQYGRQYVCQPNITLGAISVAMLDYFDRSDRELTANMVLLNLHLHSLEDPKEKEHVDSYSIHSYFAIQFLERVYSARVNGVFPTLSEFLFDHALRAMIFMKNETLSSNINYTLSMDDNYMFTNMTTYIDYGKEKATLSTGSYATCPINDTIYDYQSPYGHNFVEVFAPNKDWSNDTLRHARTCGLTAMYTEPLADYEALTMPIVNSRWSWAPDEPIVSDDTDQTSSGNPTAFKCAHFTQDGWVCANCYELYHALCRNTTNSTDLSISKEKVTYFDATAACDTGFTFHVPRTPLEQRVALSSINDTLSADQPVWIDWNCIAVDGCWVTGGSLASCPYHRYNVNRNGVALISVVAVVSFLLLCISLFLMFDKVPIRHHQAKWKRIYNKFAEQEYEGVPA